MPATAAACYTATARLLCRDIQTVGVQIRGSLGCVISGMTRQALTGWTTVFTQELLFFVAAAAEFVELRFNQGAHLGVCFVAVETQALTCIVDEVVVAADAIFCAMINVSEGDGEHGLRGAKARLAQLHAIAECGCESNTEYPPENSHGRFLIAE